VFVKRKQAQSKVSQGERLFIDEPVWKCYRIRVLVRLINSAENMNSLCWMNAGNNNHHDQSREWFCTRTLSPLSKCQNKVIELLGGLDYLGLFVGARI